MFEFGTTLFHLNAYKLLLVAKLIFLSLINLQDIAEHLTTVYLKTCERGKRCLYEGSTPPGGFPNSWVHYLLTLLPIFLCNYASLVYQLCAGKPVSGITKRVEFSSTCDQFYYNYSAIALFLHDRMVQPTVLQNLQSWRITRCIPGTGAMMKMEIKSVLLVLFAFNDYLNACLRQ